MKKFISLIPIVLSGILFSCSKEKSYEPLDINYQAKINVNDNGVVNDKIDYKGILGYDTSNYTFLIDSNAIKKSGNISFLQVDYPFHLT